MKRFVTLFVALLTLAGVIQAQEQPEGFAVGYCNGQLATVGTAGFKPSTDAKMWISAAIFVPESKARTLAGNRIDVIRAALASKTNVDSLKVWIRTSLDGEDLVSKQATTIAKGWNTFTLDESYQIPENPEGFYIGYSYHQKKSVNALSILLDPQPNALFVKFGDGEWTDQSMKGALCLEAFAVGDNLPQYDLYIENLATDRYYALSSHELKVSFNVRNLAMTTISGYKAICNFGGYDEPIVVDINQPIAYKERQQVSFVINPTMITSATDHPVPLTVTLDNLAEGDDQDVSNNSAQTAFIVLDKAFQRNVLIEEFTTEECPNCPRVAGWLHEALSKPEFSSVISWEHHSGYYYDSFTTDFDQSYEWFYNDGGSTYAPALMFDRYPKLAKTPVDLPGSEAEIEALIRARMEDPSLVNVNIKAGYQDDGKLKVIVNGERTQAVFTTLPPRINVALVETNITTNSQAGASGAFTHYNVGRAVSSVWGEEIEWNGNNYQYTCTFDVANNWVKDNLAVIAYVSQYDSTNPNNCAIANSGILRAADFGDITETLRGDINGDNQVGIDDVNAIINMMLGKAEKTDVADLSGDGEIGIDDVNVIINIMLGK